jgi:hypothetical protein
MFINESRAREGRDRKEQFAAPLLVAGEFRTVLRDFQDAIYLREC